MIDTPRLTPARRNQHAARDERLGRALRENLRRRKEQARARGATVVAEPTQDEAASDEPPA